jgi:hypothetical protein
LDTTLTTFESSIAEVKTVSGLKQNNQRGRLHQHTRTAFSPAQDEKLFFGTQIWLMANSVWQILANKFLAKGTQIWLTFCW